MPVSPPPPLHAADYEAIEAAVMETGRGRWFLSEYARRHRHADTEMLLAAIWRLETSFRLDSRASVDRVCGGLVDMADAIARTKADIAALQPDGEHGRIEAATEELDSVVSAIEMATSDILVAAEQIQELAWTLREQGTDPAHCDALDERSTDIYTACSFQDLTGQRIRKVIQVLRYLESRIDAMIDVWGRTKRAGDAQRESAGGGAPLNGPSKPGQGLGQYDIDRMMGSTATAAVPLRPGPKIDPERSRLAMIEQTPADPLAPLAAMSAEQKIALFS